MIFETKNRYFESEKERNLYYKFFAGFYFNELIPGYEDRLKEFYSLLRRPTYHVGEIPLGFLQSPPSGVFVSFDNHPDRFLGKQGGEFADILIHDSENRFLVGIEAKYLDDWDYQKDVVQNSEKLNFVGGQIGVEMTLLCLLLARNKWENVVAMEPHSGSNFRKLKEHQGTVLVLLWEDLIELKSIPRAVYSYVANQLSHPKLQPFGEGR